MPFVIWRFCYISRMSETAGPEEIIFEGKMFEVVKVREAVDGKEFAHEHARRAPGVRLIIPTPDGRLLLSKEYRSYMKRYDIRLPGGKVFDSLKEYRVYRDTGKDMQEAARAAAIKEAKEEMGIVVEDLVFLSMSECGASVEWDLYYFVVSKYAESTQALEHGEDITPVVVEREEARAMCLDGRMGEERSALTLLRYLSK